MFTTSTCMIVSLVGIHHWNLKNSSCPMMNNVYMEMGRMTQEMRNIMFFEIYSSAPPWCHLIRCASCCISAKYSSTNKTRLIYQRIGSFVGHICFVTQQRNNEPRGTWVMAADCIQGELLRTATGRKPSSIFIWKM